MKPGKKPLPTNLKILTGNKRYINSKEPSPKPVKKALKPPDWLPEIVQEKYKEPSLSAKREKANRSKKT